MKEARRQPLVYRLGHGMQVCCGQSAADLKNEPSDTHANGVVFAAAAAAAKCTHLALRKVS